MSFFCRTAAFLSLLSATGIAVAASDDTAAVTPAPQIKVCETTFFDVPLPDNASQCQPFLDAMQAASEQPDTIPASLVYFTPLANQAVIEFYQDKLSLTQHAPVSQRTLLVSEDSQVRIVVSPDNQGSQVDILVSQHSPAPAQ